MLLNDGFDRDKRLACCDEVDASREGDRLIVFDRGEMLDELSLSVEYAHIGKRFVADETKPPEVSSNGKNAIGLDTIDSTTLGHSDEIRSRRKVAQTTALHRVGLGGRRLAGEVVESLLGIGKFGLD